MPTITRAGNGIAASHLGGNHRAASHLATSHLAANHVAVGRGIDGCHTGAEASR